MRFYYTFFVIWRACHDDYSLWANNLSEVIKINTLLTAECIVSATGIKPLIDNYDWNSTYPKVHAFELLIYHSINVRIMNI